MFFRKKNCSYFQVKKEKKLLNNESQEMSNFSMGTISGMGFAQALVQNPFPRLSPC